jgi:hypothetical protein
VQTLAVGEGVEIVGAAPLPGGAANCQVCGFPLDVDLVACKKCATPHHSECWEYAGRCSPFGCGGTAATP